MKTVFSVMAISHKSPQPLFFVIDAESAAEAAASAAVYHVNNGFPDVQVVAVFTKDDLRAILDGMDRFKNIS